MRFNSAIRAALLICAGVALAQTSPIWAPKAEAAPIIRMDGRAAPPPTQASTMPVAALSASFTPVSVVLSSPSAAEAVRQKSVADDTRVGFGRTAPSNVAASNSNGQISFAVVSPGAEQLRVGLALPIGNYTVYAWGVNSPDANILHVTPGNFAMPVWSPITDGATQNILVTRDDSAEPWSASIAEVSHFDTPVGRGPNTDISKGFGDSASCQLDVVCLAPLVDAATAPDLVAAANASMLIITSDAQGNSYTCSGTLVNSNSFPTPYVLTANHCIVNQTSIVTIWFYVRTGCGTGAANPSAQQTGGATIIWHSTELDGALIELSQAPPALAGFSGWDASRLNVGDEILALHHPRGDVLKASFGGVASNDPPAITISNYTYAPGTFYVVSWDIGFVEPGSSGSGLFYHSPATHFALRGTLTGGPPQSCSASNNLADYSQLSNQYPYISQYLAATPPPPPPGTGKAQVVEYYNATENHYFITPNAVEIGLLGKPPFQDWQPTGLTFLAYAPGSPPAGAVGVCRFYNDHFQGTSTHFYAPHGLGCEDVIASFPDWTLEDPQLFYANLPDANGNCPSGQIPVYRLYNNGMGGAPNHRFTTNATVRQQMISQGYAPEGAGIGVGWCAPQ
jgi:lysyl endopeptidase